jgi:ribonuclease VapC
MVIDTSALLCVLLDEPDAETFRRAIAADPLRLVSAASLLETSMVIESRVGDSGGRELDLMIHRARIDVAAVTVEQAEVARQGFRAFGKGRHPAALNLGDCFAYALSRTSGEPLLFKGSDFSRTDVKPALG